MPIELYKKFADRLPSTEGIGEILPYGWWEIDANLSVIRWPYVGMLQDFGYELTNAINAFTLGVRRLKAWDQVLSITEDENEQLHLISEFVDGPTTLALLTPYMLRSRFFFASAHLCHQLNLTREVGWSESKLPKDTEIEARHADEQGRPWQKYIKLKLGLEKIGNREFQSATADFRNAFSHRFSPRVGFGITNFFCRRMDPESGKVTYAFGGTLPLNLTRMVELLTIELGNCYVTYGAFRALVAEQKAYVLEEIPLP